MCQGISVCWCCRGGDFTGAFITWYANANCRSRWLYADAGPAANRWRHATGTATVSGVCGFVSIVTADRFSSVAAERRPRPTDALSISNSATGATIPICLSVATASYSTVSWNGRHVELCPGTVLHGSRTDHIRSVGAGSVSSGDASCRGGSTQPRLCRCCCTFDFVHGA